MGIYRGAGGSGDAVNDASSEALITIQARDAALAAQVAAEAAQTAAELAETNAETAETNAETAETNAETAATNAASSASAASTSASNAASSASAASTSASNASTSASNAASSASAASTSASNAASSASTASTQATNASNSASAASTSATNASNSASAAATSATNAANSATAAQTARTAAELAETNAETAETNAETAETNAAASASAAATSASNASTSASNAATSATNASNSASAAATSATNASNSASAASTSATNASNSASAAATSASNAAASYDSFDDRYLGAKSSAPTLDNDGNTLLVGALYFNTSTNEMKVWSGSAWLNAYASLSGALLATNNLSDLNNTATARDNLGVEIGVDVQAYDAQLADIAGLTPTDNNFIVGNGTNFVTESGSTARTSLGLGSIATQDANNVAVTGGSINGTTVGASTPSTGSFTSLTDSGNLTFTGTGNRIIGDYNNGTLVNRVYFQNSNSNVNTSLGALPNGTGNTSQFIFYNNSDPTNAGRTRIVATNAESSLISDISGTGSYLPLTIHTGASERLRIDTSGNVGIGTSSPAQKLDVAGNAQVSSGQFTVGVTATSGLQFINDGTFGTIDSNPLKFRTAATERMRIDTSGNVGIGTTSPSGRLHVATTTNTSVYAAADAGYSLFRGVTNSSGGVLSITGNSTGNGINFTVFNAALNGYEPANYDGSIQVFKTSNTERMRIDSSGNVGIGTSSPSFGLTVQKDNGSGYVAGFRSASGSPMLTIQNTGGISQIQGLNSALSATANIALQLSGGNVGIGTASPNLFSHTKVLTISDTSSGSRVALELNGNSENANSGIWFVNNGTAAAAIANRGNGDLTFGTGSSTPERMRITSGGNVGIGTSSPSSNLVVNSSTATQFDLLTNGTRYFSAYTDTTQVILGGIQNTIVSFRQNDTERMQLDTSGNLRFNSGYGSVATAYGCRAWVNFNGTSTVSIRASGNVSSITDNGTGDYTVNISTAITDANYAIVVAAGSPGTRDGSAYTPPDTAPTTTAFKIRCWGSNAPDTKIDHSYVFAAVFR